MSTSLAWLLLILSGIADIVWAVTTKFSAGYSRAGWTAISVLALVMFLGLLTQALKILPLGTAYAVWTGIGAVGSVVAGIVLFGEAVTVARLAAVVAIIGGVVVLRVLPA
jgi:quaternary ammonium compound-resistance protein SugE